MDCGDWITLAAVIVALGIGVACILHTQSLQRRERRERLLNEIIEWAIDVVRCGLERDLPDVLHIKNYDEGRINLAVSANMLSLSFHSMEGRNKYIHSVASVFGGALQKAVNSLVKDFEKHESLLDNICFIALVKFTSVTEKNMAQYLSEVDKATIQIANQKLELDERAHEVIEQATKLKENP